jgi:hypothetical protein
MYGTSYLNELSLFISLFIFFVFEGNVCIFKCSALQMLPFMFQNYI